ncbi:NAD(P)/FAD-dependent oxidoreductase [Luteimonas sp. SJ-92]|uniref:NAD(P)/FAD-dependent oxidoreductase n=1 Tax=Luteimonas salinisoli TaxID=2752307 RepID=A0A853J7I1_9GAMM|nr:FAD/NAD(P)-binding oxidoreductase [Luteimonas salinisoli]NZA25096.1 NAD(P)/FAD-dependent oxidoreductase [Luteimonas salinisoli]
MAEPRLRCDVAVVGAGPAGLAAARAAAALGAAVLVLDAQPAVGGQVWREDALHGLPARAASARSALQALGVRVLTQAEVVGCAGNRLFVHAAQAAVAIDYDALVLATGARELLLPFPGWTLPGVTGAGGAQALAKQGWPLRGLRAVVAGSGPLLLASAATLRRHGARVVSIHEQAPAAAVSGFALGLWRWPGKAAQALQLRAGLWRSRYLAGSHVLRALGDERLEAVEVRCGARSRTIACDLLACGYGLVPNVELAQALGCALDGAPHPQVRVDGLQRSSVDGVFAAGEACGVGGVDCAALEGRIAGLAAAGDAAGAGALSPRRERARRFAASLQRHFALHDGLRRLAAPDTLVCRCEDVPLAALDGCAGAREARLAARCGMGACQGRICGTALAEMGRFPRDGLRSPIFPVPLEVLARFGDAPPPDPPIGVTT